MDLEPERAYRAIASRDRRFDGLFFVGVSTTGIYCRPICPARTPRRDRCTFHRSAALAEKAGFRACFRCRPELAPGHAEVDAVGRLAMELSRRIGEGALDHGPTGGSLEALAAELGVTSRHLRRVSERELGVSPVELAGTRRLQVAKQLLTETSLGMAEIAFASGFGSVRRFNDAFKQRFGGPPRRLGRTTSSPPDPAVLALRLAYRPPFDWQGLLAYLGPRAIPSVEEVRGKTWRRLLRSGDAVGIAEVDDLPDEQVIRVRLPAAFASGIGPLVLRFRALFDLDARPDAIRAALGTLGARAPGLRVPGCLDPFELGVRAILGQQVSVKGATTLAMRLVQAFGERHPTNDTLCRSFPSAERLASSSALRLAGIGIPSARAEALRTFADRVSRGELLLRSPLGSASEVEDTMAALRAQPGIGPWTAEYIAMRALRFPDAFVGGDLGVRKALGKGGAPVSERVARARAEAFRPFRAYAVLHLWRTLKPDRTTNRERKT